ncbi:MAG TPA: hypothetical protein VME22_12730 [Solirubrobacteraceae bacterium]|nr:hypothetical protein [Solirubrobacteraceae bacterium]
MSSLDSDRRPRPFPRRAGAWCAAGVLAGALYLLLIDTTSLPELIVAVAAAVMAATGFELAREQQTVGGLTARVRWLATAHRPLLKVPSDIAAVSLIAFRQLVRPRPVNGSFRAVPFRGGPGHDVEAGRRALAESLGSFAPNTIIVGVDEERGLILGHQLRSTGGAEAIDVLGLGSE